MASGTYTLLIELPTPTTIEVGALGERALSPGWYAYTGSALGPGGFARVDRHREVATGERDVRHWHIDYLLGHPATVLDRAVTTPVDAECAIARTLPGERIPAFGASDCDCESHLVSHEDRDVLSAGIEAAHREHEC
ncbi:DUF123 domain-containing protein [Halococcus sp. IIIV-5B]|uniref:GIY-YIG nuclease family protein n=1 Tax=Halococcus sp. IIIV-5B TaxID=2321230 RepID=UPI000E71971A|nr:GIY-YIG nuclease family protein [Halococcus sp. IIIV-5B]RJT06576.1 GIY-YIG nuclease family protein [Halococcus sp. IIIV-5B]